MSRTDDIINVQESCALMREKILDEIGTALKGRGVELVAHDVSS